MRGFVAIDERIGGEEAFGVDSGHAAGSGCGDGLAINVILAIAAGEDSGGCS